MNPKPVFLTIALIAGLLAPIGLSAKTWRVPSAALNIAAAVDSATSGQDTVLVTDNGMYGPFTLDKDILITVLPDSTPVVTGSSTLSLGEVRYLTIRRLTSDSDGFVLKTIPSVPFWKSC
jgi:hypothetical protein